jgi:DNA-binding CsgD family transcriptional regulator
LITSTTLDVMTLGRSGLSPVMVGRSRPLALLRGLVEAADCCPDGPTVALVSGEAGIGKSRLIRELMAELPSDTPVIAAGALPDTGTRPYSLARDLLAAAGEPDVGDNALVGALVTFAAARPTLVVLEDLHWADADSVGVIERFLLAAAPQTTLVASYRNEDLSRRSPGGDLVARLERRHDCEHLHLDRLTRTETAAFLANALGSAPSSALLETLHNRTGGNPFFLEELVSTVGEGDLASAALPWSLEEAVLQAMDGITPVQRRIIEAAAVCGAVTDFDTLAAVVELDEPTLIDELRALVQRDLLVERGADTFGFRHELVRDAVDATLLGRQRRRLHERIFDVLTAAGAAPAARAVHARGAERYEEFVRLAREGVASYLRTGSSFAALRLASDALAEDPDDLQLLAAATEAGWLVGLFDEAEATAERWLALTRAAGDTAGEYDARRLQIRLAFERGDGPRVDRLLTDFVAGMDALPEGHAMARALVTVAQNHMLRHRVAEAIEWADRAIVAAEAAGAPAIAVQAAIERASAMVNLEGRQVVPRMLEAVAAAEALGEWVLVARGLNNLFEVVPPYTTQGRALMERYRVAGERAGFDSLSNNSLQMRLVNQAMGEADLAAAHQAISRVAELSSFLDPSLVKLDLMEFYLAVEEGRVDESGRRLDSLDMNFHCSFGIDPGLERLLDAGARRDRAAAARWMAALPDQPAEHGPVDIHLLAVEAALRAGVDPTDVRTCLVDRWLGTQPDFTVVAPFIDGMLALAAGDHETAWAHLDPALAEPDEAISRYLIGHLRTLAATAALGVDDRAAALTLCEVALDDLRRWPGWRRDQAEALHRRLTGAARPADGELTSREREVAILLAEGLTNGQLAERLYISPKTAAVHVSNILMKLQMANRAEVAAWAVRTGLATSAA